MIDYTADLHQRCLSFLDEPAARLYLSRMESVTVAAGKLLFAEDDRADGLHWVVSGRVAVQKPTGFADRTQVVALLDPGAPVGENGLLPEGRHAATVTAVEGCRLVRLSREAFENLAVEQPAAAIALLKWVLGRTSLRLQKNAERLAHVL